MDPSLTLNDEEGNNSNSNLTAELNRMREALFGADKTPILLSNRLIDFHDLEGLEALLDALERRSASLRDEIVSVVGSKFSRAGGALRGAETSEPLVLQNAAHDLKEMAAGLRRDAERVALDIGARESLGAHTAAVKRLQAKLKATDRRLEYMDVLASFRARGEEFDADLAAGRFSAAAQHLIALETSLNELKDRNPNALLASSAHPVVVEDDDDEGGGTKTRTMKGALPSVTILTGGLNRSIKLQTQQRRASIIARLSWALRKCLIFTTRKLEVRPTTIVKAEHEEIERRRGNEGAAAGDDDDDVENHFPGTGATASLTFTIRYDDVLTALRTLGCAAGATSSLLTRGATTFIFEPLLSPTTLGNVVRVVKQANVLEVVVEDEVGKEKVSSSDAIASVESRVMTVLDGVASALDFFASIVLQGDKDCIRALSAELVEKTLLGKVVARLQEEVGTLAASSLDDFSSIATGRTLASARKFERETLLRVCDVSSNAVSSFIAEMEVNVAKRRRVDLLQRARTILLSPALCTAATRTEELVIDITSPRATAKGKNAKWTCPPMTVSMRAVEFVRLLEETSRRTAAHSPSTSSAQTLGRTLRDCLSLLFVFEELGAPKDSRPTLVARNDWEFSARFAVTAAGSYAADLIPAMLEKAGRCLQDEVKRNVAETMRALKASPGVNSPPSWDIDAAMEVVEVRCEEARTLLPPSASAHACVLMIKGVVEYVIRALLDASRPSLGGPGETRAWLVALSRLADRLETKGGADAVGELRRICGCLQPHMSLPLFRDQVVEEQALEGWKQEDVVRLARLLFGGTSTPSELAQFEQSLSYY